MQPQAIGSVPAETARVAHAAFPKGNLYLRMRDELGTIYQDEMFAPLFPTQGQPACAPWRLALVSIVQFLEGLSDRQVAEAVRGRIDLKYLLGLELSDPGFNFSVLSEFRTRLLSHQSEELLFTVLLEQFVSRGWLKAGGKQRTDSTHVLGAVRLLNRLELIGETLRAALNSVAKQAPHWLSSWMPAHWLEQYRLRVEEYRLPKGEKERLRLAEAMGADGAQLLQAVFDQSAPSGLSQLPTVQALRHIWVQQFWVQEGRTRLRNKDDLPPAHLRLDSPYDAQVRYSEKHSTRWVGFKVHVTESCEEDELHLITHVQTTEATTADLTQTLAIQEALIEKKLAPDEHLMDGGYVDAQVLVHSQQQQHIHVVGPVHVDVRWQAQRGQGYELSAFTLDWQRRVATCPQGQQSVQWWASKDHSGHAISVIRFAQQDCACCPVRALCTTAKTAPRQLAVRPQAEHEALQAARRRQESSAFKEEYARRAGIEGTLSQGVRAFELRQSRYRGLEKTHLQHLLTAAAINLVRWDAYKREVPPAKTRTSRLAALASARAS
ncbi:MAG: IS1182 family transposase [Chloroflexi bacterium]|nr:IS1182 family transposase [Chloroflexota bacterium]